jgi:hypothetical protein
LACAFGIPTDKSVAIQAAKAIDESFLICAPEDSLVAASGLLRLPNRGVRELPPTCRGYPHCSAAGPKIFFQYELRFANCLNGQLVITHPCYPSKNGAQKKQNNKSKRSPVKAVNQKSSPSLENIPVFLNYPINFCFRFVLPGRPKQPLCHVRRSGRNDHGETAHARWRRHSPTHHYHFTIASVVAHHRR